MREGGVPFSHLRRCREPSLPLRRASRRSSESRRRRGRGCAGNVWAIGEVGGISIGTASLTELPWRERGRAGMSPEMMVVGSIAAAALGMNGEGGLGLALGAAMTPNNFVRLPCDMYRYGRRARRGMCGVANDSGSQPRTAHTMEGLC